MNITLSAVNNEIALKCWEPLPVHMQISTCAYLISMRGIRRACHLSCREPLFVSVYQVSDVQFV